MTLTSTGQLKVTACREPLMPRPSSRLALLKAAFREWRRRASPRSRSTTSRRGARRLRRASRSTTSNRRRNSFRALRLAHRLDPRPHARGRRRRARPAREGPRARRDLPVAVERTARFPRRRRLLRPRVPAGSVSRGRRPLLLPAAGTSTRRSRRRECAAALSVVRDPGEAGVTMRAIFDGLIDGGGFGTPTPTPPSTSTADRCEREILRYLLPGPSGKGEKR